MRCPKGLRSMGSNDNLLRKDIKYWQEQDKTQYSINVDCRLIHFIFNTFFILNISRTVFLQCTIVVFFLNLEMFQIAAHRFIQFFKQGPAYKKE